MYLVGALVEKLQLVRALGLHVLDAAGQALLWNEQGKDTVDRWISDVLLGPFFPTALDTVVP